jgi:glycosyltransferase involved in cell wall biosynthesis
MSAPLLNLATILRELHYTNTLYRDERELVHSEYISRISADSPFACVQTHSLDSDLGTFLNPAARILGMSEVDRVAVDFCRRRRKLVREQILIGYDNFGASMAWFCSRFTRTPYLVFSLELAEGSTPSRWERAAWRDALAVLTFDHQRAEILERGYGLRSGSCICVPNSSIGDSYESSSSSLRHRLRVPPDKHVVLMVGALIQEHCFYDVMTSVPTWPESFALVIHGWGMKADDREIFESTRRRCPNRLFYSDDILPQERKPDVFAGADIGIVAYTDKTLNHRFAGASSGKLFDFCQAGVPVLASELPGMRDLVEGNGIGKVVQSFSGIGQALGQLVADREGYRHRCHEFFERNEFRLRMTAVLDAIGV